MDTEGLRRVSSAVFGHRYRLELLAALAVSDEEGVCVSTLAARLGVAASVFYPPIRALIGEGLIRRVGPTQTSRRVFYTTVDHPAWTGLRQMVEDLGVVISGRGAGAGVAR
ncbi:helix-turn-helix domain-containing protein [Salinispora arenicola]|uniref:helix-turn-helix domain-containing protein n=1 Tax=Salinispora arenicola TaxID=168697 RepID=UPI000371348F|nr:helix-turn-helix domain-containing protein [Salinispora arenicola]